MTILLHGFWGQPSDWNLVLHKLPLGLQVMTPDLYLNRELAPHFLMKDWSENFWRRVDETVHEEKIELIGYSMGARLAVAAAVRCPDRVSRALFVSGNPLRLTGEEAAARDLWEKNWLENFLKLDWSDLEKKWQELPIFNHAPAAERRKTSAMRELLGLSLRRWSPREHSFSSDDVKMLPGRMEWAFGATDQKYVTVAKSLQELPVQGQISLIPNAGHRLITEAADFISHWIEKGSQT